MRKDQKLVDIFIAEDGAEFFSASQCEEHERKLGEEKAHSLTKRMGEATMQWISDNPEEWRAIEHRCLGLDEFGRTETEQMIDDFLGYDPLPRGTEWFNESRHDRSLEFGIAVGWWAGRTDDGDPIRHPKVIKISELEEHETLMAHIVAKEGFFKSVNDAKKNGWNKPVETGDFWFKKKTVCLRIVD